MIRSRLLFAIVVVLAVWYATIVDARLTALERVQMDFIRKFQYESRFTFVGVFHFDDGVYANPESEVR